MWPSRRFDRVGTRNQLISELHVLPTDTPAQRFKCGLATALAWLGARVVRYSFPVRLFNSLLMPVYPGAIQSFALRHPAEGRATPSKEFSAAG